MLGQAAETSETQQGTWELKKGGLLQELDESLKASWSAKIMLLGRLKTSWVP